MTPACLMPPPNSLRTRRARATKSRGPAVLSGVTCRTIEGDYGVLDVSQLEDKVRPVNDHLVRTRLVCLENTHNRGGGRVYPLEKIEAISAWARR